MRKYVLFLIFSLVINILKAQTVDEKLMKKMCECITFSIDNKSLNDQKFDTCWSTDTSLIKEIEDFFLKNDTLNTDEEAGYRFGKIYFEKNQTRFISECDGFYQYIDSSRYEFLNEVKPTIQLKLIDSLTQQINLHKDESELYHLRGLAYFSLLKFNEAKSDFNKALSLPHASIQCLYFRAWIAEIEGNYDDAIADYKLAKKNSGIVYIDMLIAITERKKKEKK